MIVTYCLTDFPEVIPDSLMRAIATAGSGENGKILKDALIVAHTEELKLFLSKALEFSKMSGLPITAI